VLDGVITLRTLLLSRDDEIVSDLMEDDVIKVHTSDDKEDVAYLFSRYDYLSIPVVDSEDRLVGIITYDDIIDVMEDETTEDFERMAATIPSGKPYLKTPAWELARNRIVWLTVLMISGVITGGILSRYEAFFTTIPLLVTFIPMLTNTGGNAGSQSSTLVIRGMVLNEIDISDGLKVLWKEFRVSLIAGLFLAVINYIRLYITYPGQEKVVLVVSLSIFATVILAKVVGGLLPMAAKILKLDPAIMAAPLITTIVDAMSLMLYFALAGWILNL
jgi:magnesium transporter